MPFNYVSGDDAILTLEQAAVRIVQLEKQVALLMEVMEPIFPTVKHAIKVNMRVDEEIVRDELEQLADAKADGDLSEPIESDLPS